MFEDNLDDILWDSSSWKSRKIGDRAMTFVVLGD